MFELPSAKRVRRSDLFSPHPSSASSSPPPSREVLQSTSDDNLHFEFDFVSGSQTSESRAIEDAVQNKEESHDGAYEFRLFTSTPITVAGQDDGSSKGITTAERGAGAVSKIRIRSLTPLSDVGGGTFKVLSRPESYYFADGEDLERAGRFLDIAVEAGDILARAKSTKWPGTALPWRVVHIQSIYGSPPRDSCVPAIRKSGKSRRTRPGKKRRIARRRRRMIELQAVETEQQKRTRRNREKKVKKKQRDKKKKVQGNEARGLVVL